MTTQLERVVTDVGHPVAPLPHPADPVAGRLPTTVASSADATLSLQSFAGRLHGTTILRRRRTDDGFSASGRAVARLMDEVLIGAFGPAGLIVAPGRLEVDHIAPVPFNAPIAVTTWITHREGRHVFAAATLYASNCLLVQAQGAYLVTGTVDR